MNTIAANFFDTKVPDRIMGSECEYDMQFKVEPDDSELENLILEGLFKNRTRGGLNYVEFNANSMLANGARMYADCGLIEYATPECLGPLEAAAADFAGMTVMKQLATALSDYNTGLYRRTGSYLDDPEGVMASLDINRTSGYHENYIVPQTVAKRIHDDGWLATYLATRVWSWSGMIGRHGYQISQKIDGIGDFPILNSRDPQNTQHGGKPMATIILNDEDKDINPDSSWKRVEVRFADAGQARRARLMAFGVTSLILRMGEHAKKLEKKDSLWVLQDPITTARIAAADMQLTQTYRTRSNQRVTAIDIQEAITQSARRLSTKVELPESELLCIELLQDTVDRLRRCDPTNGDYEPITGFVDWAAKFHLMRNVMGVDDLSVHNAHALDIDLKWDLVSPKGISQMWWNRNELDRDIVPDTLVSQLEQTAPQYTRANIRGNLIAQGKLYRAGWADGAYDDGTPLWLPDPYQFSLDS